MKKYRSVIGIVAAVAIIGLLPRALYAEPQLVTESGFSGGIVVALDFSDGKAIADLAVKDSFVVHSLLTTEAGVEKARREIVAAGRYGRISCDLYNGRDLPYVDGLVNIVLCKSSCQVPAEELMRVIAPGGLLLVEGPGGWKKTVKPKSAGTDEWNQYLHGADNNGVSRDNVGPPQRLRWHAGPEYGRHKALSPSFPNMVSADGVVFTIEDWATTENVNAESQYYLVARDAYNGIQLWKRTMPKEWLNWQGGSIKDISTQQQRCLAAVGKTVYFCTGFGSAILALDSRTGDEKQVYKQTEKTAEFLIEGNLLYGIKGAPFKVGKSDQSGNVELYALDLSKGSMVWNKPITNDYTGGTLVIKGPRLVYHCKDGLVCVDSATKQELWTVPVQDSAEATIFPDAPDTREKEAAPTPRRARNTKTTRPPTDYTAFTGNDQPTSVLTDDMVFCAIGNTIVGKTLAQGNTLWTASGRENYQKSPDLFVADGLVWSRDLQGRDPQTGDVVRTLTQEMIGPMSHDRCYRNRITHRYYLNSATGGTDFLALDGSLESPNPWVRSTCGLAIMPANGMIYNGPFVCQCAIGTLISGMNAVYNGSENTGAPFIVEVTPRLVKGPAFGGSDGATATASDWPTYRYSGARSAVADAPAAGSLTPKWNVNIGTQPTAPVVAGDTVYVADRDNYTLHALDREDGQTRWTYVADGLIDCPPTYHNGMVLFGTRTGWVYCLRASDGQLAWKFTGLPERRLICDSGRLESAWPVNGSVLIFQDRVYFTAGRSSFLDGGIGVFALDPSTGAMKHGRMIRGPYEKDRPNFPIPADGQFQVDGFRSEIFSSCGNELFVRNQSFTPDLEPISPDDVRTLHLMSSAGLLNDSPEHRTYWTVDWNLRYGGPTGNFGSGPGGDIIAFDGKKFYEVRGYAPGRNLPGRGKGLNPLELYSIYSGSLSSVDGKVNSKAIPGIGRWDKQWETPVPFAGHAVVVSENTVLAAGVPLLKGYAQEDIDASYAGKKGGIAWLLDVKSGKKLQELRFDAAPVWDGIAIAHKSYFICLKDGSVVCLSDK
ncbi:PQQ-binding-like beta-propeller repeat protein [Planctomycetota bacterium]